MFSNNFSPVPSLSEPPCSTTTLPVIYPPLHSVKPSAPPLTLLNPPSEPLDPGDAAILEDQAAQYQPRPPPLLMPSFTQQPRSQLPSPIQSNPFLNIIQQLTGTISKLVPPSHRSHSPPMLFPVKVSTKEVPAPEPSPTLPPPTRSASQPRLRLCGRTATRSTRFTTA